MTRSEELKQNLAHIAELLAAFKALQETIKSSAKKIDGDAAHYRAELLAEERAFAAAPFEVWDSLHGIALKGYADNYPIVKEILGFPDAPLMWNDAGEVIAKLEDDEEKWYIYINDARDAIDFIKRFHIQIDLSTLRERIETCTHSTRRMQGVLKELSEEFGLPMEI